MGPRKYLSGEIRMELDGKNKNKSKILELRNRTRSALFGGAGRGEG